MARLEKKPRTKITGEAQAMKQPRAQHSRRLFTHGGALATLALIAIAAYVWMIPPRSDNSTTSSAASAQTLAVVKIGAPAPDMAFTTVDGAQRRLSEFRGRPVMLWLFATWCPTCVYGTVAVAEKFDRIQRSGIQIIQLKLYNNLGYPGPSVEDFARRYAGSIPRSSDWLWGAASQEGSYTYDPRGYPDVYFLIDKDGVLQAINVAPHVTMDTILAFARSVSVAG